MRSVISAVGGLVLALALHFWLAAEATATLRARRPGDPGVVLVASFGRNWAVYSDRRWWAEVHSIDSGWPSARVTDASGREIFMDLPSFAGNHFVDDLDRAHGGRYRGQILSSGWPMRTWVVVRASGLDAGSGKTALESARWSGLVVNAAVCVIGVFCVETARRRLFGHIAAKLREGWSCCPACGYSLAELPEGPRVCPECGAASTGGGGRGGSGGSSGSAGGAGGGGAAVV